MPSKLELLKRPFFRIYGRYAAPPALRGRMTARQIERMRRIRRIERDVRSMESQRGDPSVQPIVFFDASSHLSNLSFNAATGLLAAWSLRASGRPVRYLHCRGGLGHCVLGTDAARPSNPPPCERCAASNSIWYPPQWTIGYDPPPAGSAEELKAIAEMGLDELLDYEHGGLALGKFCLPAARWILRRHDLSAIAQGREVMAAFVAAALGMAERFGTLLDEIRPAGALVFNGTFFPEATARAVALARGIPVSTFEIGYRPLSAFFTMGEATDYPLDIPGDFALNAARERQLDENLAARFSGRATMGGVKFWPEMKTFTPELKAKCEAHRRIVPVFTNVIFDTSQKSANSVFASMFDWLEATGEAARANPDTLFILRAHPDELRPGKASEETVSDWLKKSGFADLPNVHLIPPQEMMSSYELVGAADFCIVYNSTIGLEATIMGKPVVTAGHTKYSQTEVTHSPATPEAYRELVGRFISDGAPPVAEDSIRRARRFMYFMLFKSSLDLSAYIEQISRYDYTFKSFGPGDLDPENSPELGIIHRGMTGGGSFSYE